MRFSFLFAVAAVLVAQQQHRTEFTGTWKLNVGQSKYPPGMAPQRATLQFTEDGTTKFSVVNSEGRAIEWSFPWSGGKPVPIDGASMKHHETTDAIIRGRKWKGEIKADGRTNTLIDATVSEDGKTMTGLVSYIDLKGKREQHTEVYDRQ